MEEADATTIEYPAESFDVIYSRDTILHIKDKLSLYKNFLKWLKPGGRLMVSDYNCTPDTFNDEFKAYVAQRGYNLHTVLEYGNIVQEAGFRFVSAVDETDFMVKMLQEELDKLANMKDEFIKEFSQKDHDDLYNGWHAKLERIAQGQQCWGLYTGKKPTESYHF